MPSIKLFAAALSAALLAACASVPTATRTTPAQQQGSAYRDAFDAAGKLSVKYRKDGNPESLTGSFNWSQKPGRIDVTLSSPMATIATISITPQSATLVQSDKVPRVAKDIDTLTAQTLGWSLPVSGLRDWLQGYATGADGKRFVATPANNTVTTNDGWRLRFVSWQDDKAARPQPKRIDAERIAAASADELAIRIFIDPQG
ncbi:outer membrane lipoprotein LolB [Massilia eurypsychrophila]|jgi:outer membrane lipoprotein LolB|uniref:Outer-membrane lipoprotein LolB n=1 Tax=Massilia eurypsychrophila TaxID=1485217 RepID=A0A2G8TDG7_9BURK|nr:outer membrane lipoprotein LolB [Massilia eurypsychrophila]PIL44106.1 outer membrane lipoprotein LolB [Massilia eurypsychrophila]